MPKNILLKFKNDDYFAKKKTESKPKNTDLFASSKEDNPGNEKDSAKLNFSNSSKANESSKIISNPSEEKNTNNINKGNDFHNLISGNQKKENDIKKNSIINETNNEFGFTFQNSIFKKYLRIFFIKIIFIFIKEKIFITIIYYFLASNPSNNVNKNNTKNNPSNLFDGIDFNSIGSTNKNNSNRDLFNVSSNTNNANINQNSTSNSIFDNLGDVFSKTSPPNSKIKFKTHIY